MSRRDVSLYVAVLLVLGAGWGITQPLTKIAVSEGYKHFGLLFWQMALGFLVMSLIGALRGIALPINRSVMRVYLIIALIGSVLPNTASYQAAVHLPSGILSILLSMVPMWAFPIALALGTDRFAWRRLLGLVLGLTAILLIVLPGADTSVAIPAFWVMIGLISGLFYAFEGNYVARWGTAGLDPMQVLWGASAVGTIIALPLALGSGQWISPLPPYGAPDIAQVANSTVHVLTYAGYVWLVGRAGAVFAVQVSYLVTLFGLFWARLFFGESYPSTVWVALGLMLIGMYLVQPRAAAQRLEGKQAIGETGA